jgi:DNA modification methylase
MQLFHIDRIFVPENRQRREFDPMKITELANSILAHGLLQPIVIRVPRPGEKTGHPEDLMIVAGERRLRAIKELYELGQVFSHDNSPIAPNFIPCTYVGELDELAAEEAELEENFRRVDLTWQEQAQAVKRLHELRTKQAAQVGKPITSLAIAVEAFPDLTPGGAVNKAIQQITLARALEVHPEVGKAKDVKEAVKALKRIETADLNRKVAAAAGMTYNSSIHELHNVDCMNWLRDYPAGQFDVILTDPPYGMGANKFGDGAGNLVNAVHKYEDSYESWVPLMTAFAAEAYRVAKDQAHAYIFCDFDRFHELKKMMEAAGWYVFRTPLVNHKPNSGRIPLPEHGPKRQYELILYAIKGDKKVNGVFSDVISSTLEAVYGHGANKPVELYVDLLRRSIRPGDWVLDAFAGTGTIFPAAHKFRAKAIGLELNPEYYGIAVTRLNELDQQPEML